MPPGAQRGAAASSVGEAGRGDLVARGRRTARGSRRDGSSQQEANQWMSRLRQCSSISRYSLLAELDAVAVLHVGDVPQGVSRTMSRWCRGTQISGVRFWNLTASHPAAAATSMSLLAMADVAVVVDADLADDETGLGVAYRYASDIHWLHRCLIPQAHSSSSRPARRRDRGERLERACPVAWLW